MKKRCFVILSLLCCTGCARLEPSAPASAPGTMLYDSVTRSVYPQEQSVFSDVYEPFDQTRELVPKLPGEPSAGQQKPPLLNN
ncbi:hypothetical protein JOC55_001263 [Paenibacillus sacheonensis]|nr:hypothetical protein [Paenibacillus sacheonensis]